MSFRSCVAMKCAMKCVVAVVVVILGDLVRVSRLDTEVVLGRKSVEGERVATELASRVGSWRAITLPSPGKSRQTSRRHSQS